MINEKLVLEQTIKAVLNEIMGFSHEALANGILDKLHNTGYKITLNSDNEIKNIYKTLEEKGIYISIFPIVDLIDETTTKRIFIGKVFKERSNKPIFLIECDNREETERNCFEFADRLLKKL